MIAVDTSSLMSYLSGDSGSDVNTLDDALKAQILILPPVVLTEILSDPELPQHIRNIILELPLLDNMPGFWERAGSTRAKILIKGFKARVADALIAQSCLDYNVSLITRDKDFRHFEKFVNLRVVW